MEGSKRFKLDMENLRKIGVGAIIAVLGALVTYGAEQIPNIDFGVYTPVAVAVASVIVNTVRKLLTDYSE